MFRHTQEPITEEEKSRQKNRAHGLFINWLFPKRVSLALEGPGLVDVYGASVEKCFMPATYNEELPLYLLDLGGLIMILFGEWMFDPNTLIAPADVFEMWHSEEAFFARFTLRCSADGNVFRLAVEGNSFMQAQRLPANLRFKRLRECLVFDGNGATLVDDLRKAGIAEIV